MSNYEGFPEEPVLHGYEGLKHFLSLLHEGIGVTKNEPVEMIELDRDRVFVEGRTTIRGDTSGAEVSSPPFGQVIEFRDGLIARVDNYSDPAVARSAAGLSKS
jgi:ketosteroid isomerase-like protein